MEKLSRQPRASLHWHMTFLFIPRVSHITWIWRDGGIKGAIIHTEVLIISQWYVLDLRVRGEGANQLSAGTPGSMHLCSNALQVRTSGHAAPGVGTAGTRMCRPLHVQPTDGSWSLASALNDL